MADVGKLNAVRLSQTLSGGESNYVAQRKERIHKWLQSQGIECDLIHLPRVALLGSGGGERAMVGLLGSLQQLIEDELMDSILYLAGVSGSTWCMASLYREAGWSSGFSKRCADVVNTLEGQPLPFSHAVQWLRQRQHQDPDFTLTDFWSAYITSQITKEMNDSPLSAHGNRTASDPYPIYSAIELDVHKQQFTEAVWFEMTPNDSGFSELGAYLPTSMLRRQFGGNESKEEPQLDMILLQGICGSAFPKLDTEDVKATTSKWIWNLIRGISPNLSHDSKGPEKLVYSGECSCLPSQVIKSVRKLNGFADDPNNPMAAPQMTEEMTHLEKLLEGHVDNRGQPLFKMDHDTWHNLSLRKKMEYIDTVSKELIHTAPTWTQVWHNRTYSCCIKAMENMTTKDVQEKEDLIQKQKDVAWVTSNIFPLLGKYEWGTTSNFLYNNKDAPLPNLVCEEKIHLVDSGLRMNLAFPPVLHAVRKVNLIISLDFSQDDPFESLFLARDYAQQHKLPFPKVEDSLNLERNHPQDCYVFRARDSTEPTVIHMPLFNLQNCKDEEDVLKEKETFSTFQSSYSPCLILALLEKARTNLRNNKDKILGEIQKASITIK